MSTVLTQLYYKTRLISPCLKAGVLRRDSIKKIATHNDYLLNQMDEKRSNRIFQGALSRLKEERKDRHSFNCVLPYKASNPENEEAFISLYLSLDFLVNGRVRMGEGKRPNLEKLASQIEYLGEDEPWVKNPRFKWLERTLRLGWTV